VLIIGGRPISQNGVFDIFCVYWQLQTAGSTAKRGDSGRFPINA
jgi:hypothetical protein